MKLLKNITIIIFISINYIISQCDSSYTYYNIIPSNVVQSPADSCFSNEDLAGLNDLINVNNLQYDTPLNIGTQRWWDDGRLKTLVADYNSSGSGVNDTIYVLPESIGNWTRVIGLWLEWNRISSFPDSFNKLKELRSLYISNNVLESIISDIDSLSKLIYLDLGYNNIDSVPSSLCNLNDLQYLWLFNNNLNLVPDCICSMSIDWNNDDSAFYPYFAIGGNSLCANIPECILNSENFNVSLDQFYYSIQVTDNQDCGTVGIKNTKIIPDDFKFNNPYPNPFNPRTKFFIDFPSASYLTLSVYDINGELVSTLYNGRIRSGIRKFIWDANGYSSGVYLIKASTKAKIIYKKVIFTK